MKKPYLGRLEPDFLARWDRWYPNTPPVGFLLRGAYPDLWLRIHAMPIGKRVPTSGWDYAELLRRFNVVAEDILGDSSPCALVLIHECGCLWSDELQNAGVVTDSLSDLGALPRQLWDENDGVFAVPMCMNGAATTWRRGLFDWFFVAATQGRLKGLLVEQNRGTVFAPYDGGADLILASSLEREQAMERYRPWISARADGL